MAEVRTHSTTLALSEPLPAEVPAGADLRFKVQVSCKLGCDLHGLPVKVTPPNGPAVTSTLAIHEAEINESAEITLKAPPELGEHTWSIVFPAHESDGLLHEETILTLAVTSVPHGTSLAVWDIPSPALLDGRFTIKVGAKSASAFALKGCDIEVCDDTGAVVGRGRLTETPWPGTSALYWAEVSLVAPSREGLCAWSVKFAPSGVALPHEGSRTDFSFPIARAPEHRLVAKVIDKETKAPVEDAIVRLGAYRAATDQSGRAEVKVPKGTYDLTVWKAGYDSPPQPMAVNGDIAVEVEVVQIPEVNPDAYWTA